MTEYVTYEETVDFLNSDEFDGVPQSTLAILITAGKEIIDGFLKRPLDNPPALVKVVNMELVRVMLADASKNAETVEDYSYTSNPSAFSQILTRLKFLVVDDEPVSDTGKLIRARLI